VVRLDLDFDPWNPGGECVPLRLAKPFAGKRQTGMHFPALDGDEAIVEFLNGNPNTPYIAAFQHNSIATDLVTSQDRLLSRNRIVTQSGNEMDMEDWLEQEHVRLSTPHSGTSQLTLGHMPDRERRKRGAGFELRSSAYGSMRAGKGLLLTTHDRPNAQGMQLDMQEALKQLEATRQQIAELSKAALAAKAMAADADAVNRVLQDEIKDLKQAVMLLTANASVAVVSPNSIVHSAGENLVFAAASHVDTTAMGNVRSAAGQQIGLFAKQGIEQIANRGPISVQAQNGSMLLQALQDLDMTSTEGTLNLKAKKEVRIQAGDSCLVINSNGIRAITPGDIVEQCATWKKTNPASENRAVATVPAQAPALCSTQSNAAGSPRAAVLDGD
jgi:type VI secretion system secreted protein VgrG